MFLQESQGLNKMKFITLYRASSYQVIYTHSLFKTKQTLSSSLLTHCLYFSKMWGHKLAFQIKKIHSVSESIAHLWPSTILMRLKGCWPEQVGKALQNFESLGLPKHNWSTLQILHKQNLVPLAFCAATTLCVQKVLTFLGICSFTAFHNTMCFSAVQITSLKTLRGGGTLHFSALNPETASLAFSRQKISLGCLLKPPRENSSLQLCS